MPDSRYKPGSSGILIRPPLCEMIGLRFPRSLRPCSWSFLTGLPAEQFLTPRQEFALSNYRADYGGN